MKRLFLIANGKMYFTDRGEAVELPSETLRHYKETVHERAKSKEWKNNGSGAMFMGMQPQTDAESAVRAVRSSVNDIACKNNSILYSIRIDESSGIYQKSAEDLSAEGIVLSSTYGSYGNFRLDEKGERMLYSFYSYSEKERHLGLYSFAERRDRELTCGNSRETSPSFVPENPDLILYSGCGLEEVRVKTEEEEETQPHPGLFSAANENEGPAGKSPSAVYSLSLDSGEITELASSPDYDYLSPEMAPDGSLYYIRRPYKSQTGGGTPIVFFFKMLWNLILLPFRLLVGLAGFLSVFTMKYGGQNLSTGNMRSKQKSQRDLFIEGNIIHAEQEQKANQKAGDINPGCIPHSYQLVRRDRSGNETVLKKGVSTFMLDEDGIYCSNGSSLLKLTSDGKEEKLLSLDGISVIREA